MSKVKKANFNGFYIEHNPRFSFNQLDGIKDDVCMGWALNQYVKIPSAEEVKAKIKETVTKVAGSAVTSAQNKIMVKVANKIYPQPSVPSSPNVSQTPDEANQEAMQQDGSSSITKFITQPLDPNIKMALIAGGGLVGVILLLSTIKSLSR